MSRQMEKDQLSGLNDRLASYIEVVRNLEAENRNLTIRLQESEKADRHSWTEASGQYELRIEELSKQIEDVHREKAM